MVSEQSHNPYFNRWFSAIHRAKLKQCISIVTILILIDGFLQFIPQVTHNRKKLSQSLF